MDELKEILNTPDAAAEKAADIDAKEIAKTAVCPICPRHCELAEGMVGMCGARENKYGTIACVNYGILPKIELRTMETIPIAFFNPGAVVLSIGSFGCNMHCPSCNEYHLAMPVDDHPLEAEFAPPAQVALLAGSAADEHGAKGVAFMYNEPVVGFEYIGECAANIKSNEMLTVMSTNGMICDEPLRAILPMFDAFNIDFKTFNEDYYKELGGDLSTVMNTIETCASKAHVEITNLIIPGKNDSEGEIKRMARWLASIDPDIPFHITRALPCYQMENMVPVTEEKIYILAEAASKYLNRVCLGNVSAPKARGPVI